MCLWINVSIVIMQAILYILYIHHTVYIYIYYSLCECCAIPSLKRNCCATTQSQCERASFLSQHALETSPTFPLHWTMVSDRKTGPQLCRSFCRARPHHHHPPPPPQNPSMGHPIRNHRPSHPTLSPPSCQATSGPAQWFQRLMWAQRVWGRS